MILQIQALNTLQHKFPLSRDILPEADVLVIHHSNENAWSLILAVAVAVIYSPCALVSISSFEQWMWRCDEFGSDQTQRSEMRRETGRGEEEGGGAAALAEA